MGATYVFNNVLTIIKIHPDLDWICEAYGDLYYKIPNYYDLRMTIIAFSPNFGDAWCPVIIRTITFIHP